LQEHGRKLRAAPEHQQCGSRKRGRPRVYGSKIKLRSLLDDPTALKSAPSLVCGENKVTIQYRSAICSGVQLAARCASSP
jgi:hypothetical protein